MEKRRRDLPVTLYRILLYLSRMRERGVDARRLMRIERAVGVERKELRLHLQRMHEAGYIHIEERMLRVAVVIQCLCIQFQKTDAPCARTLDVGSTSVCGWATIRRRSSISPATSDSG